MMSSVIVIWGELEWGGEGAGVRAREEDELEGF
jgi:hypothetical protein